MITPQTNYDVTKERPNKREANAFIFQGVSNHFNHTGVCFPSITAGDIAQLAEVGVLNNTARLIAFENGSYLCNSSRGDDKPENWKKIVSDGVANKLCEVLNIEDKKQIKVITNDDKLVALSNLYEKTLDFGFYDFCHGPGCFEQWLIKRHLNAYKIGADLCFTIAIGGKASFRGIGSFIQNAERANFPISHFGNDGDAATAVVEKTITYLSRWVEFKRVAIYQDKNRLGNGDPMCCFHCVLKKHFEPLSDNDFVKENPSAPASKNIEFFEKFEQKIVPLIRDYFCPEITPGAKYKKSELYNYVVGRLPEAMQFQSNQSYKTKWLFEIVDRIYGNEFTRISNPGRLDYWFERNGDCQANLTMHGNKCEEPINKKEKHQEAGSLDEFFKLFKLQYELLGKQTFGADELFEGKIDLDGIYHCVKALANEKNLSIKFTLEKKSSPIA